MMNDDHHDVIDLTHDDDDNNDDIDDHRRQCCICLEIMTPGSMEYLPCMHAFHNSCVTRWLDANGSCPVCKNSVGERSMAGAM